jgi:hypothetical protein
MVRPGIHGSIRRWATRLKPVVVLALLAPTSPAQAQTGLHWKEFNSSTGFSTMYPASWFRIGLASEGRLDILSSKGGAEAIIIKRGQAQISVIELRDPPDATLAQLMDEDAQGAVAIVSRTDVPNQGAGNNGCSDFKELVSKYEAVPAEDALIHVPYIIDTDYYCEVNGRKFTTRLRYWEDDQRKGEYQRVVLRMAKSLRVSH